MPKGRPLTADEQSCRRREIVNASIKLFLAHGFAATSMREVAEAVGMGKSSLYDYFTTKDDILLFIIDDMVTTLIERAQVIASLDIAPDARLKQIMQMQASYLQSHNNLFWLLNAETQHMKPATLKLIQERRYVFQDLVGSIIQDGIAQRCFRMVDTLLAARLLLNSLFSVLYTSRPTGSVEAMLDEAVEIFLRGIKL